MKKIKTMIFNRRKFLTISSLAGLSSIGLLSFFQNCSSHIGGEITNSSTNDLTAQNIENKTSETNAIAGVAVAGQSISGLKQ